VIVALIIRAGVLTIKVYVDEQLVDTNSGSILYVGGDSANYT
jgi:hypothetical protein